jgi:mannosyltransferase
LVERQTAVRCQIRRYGALLAIVLLAFGLRAYDLARGPLWFDEALSGVISAKGWEAIVGHTLSTPFEHPPLYYLILHLWVGLAGSSAFSLRFFSLFWGVLLIPLLVRFIAPWGGRRLAFLTALLTAISVSSIGHSQNARMYTLVAFLGVLSLLLFFRGLRQRRLRWWAGYAFVTGVGISIHYYFALLLLVPIVFLLLSGSRYRRILAFFVILILATGLLSAAWLWVSPGLRQALQQVQRGEGAGASSLVIRTRTTIQALLLEEPAVGPVALGILALVGVFFWPLSPTRRAHPVGTVGSRRFLLIWLLVPWLVALAIPYWLQGRHLVYLWPALFALAAAGLLALRARGAWLFTIGLLLVAATSIYGLYRQNQQVLSRPDYGQILAYIEDQAQPDDLVLLNQPSMWPFVDYYARRSLKVAYVPTKQRVLAEEGVAQRLESLVEGRSRVWLGPISAWTSDPESLVERWLVTHAFQANKVWFPESSSAALYFTAGEQMVPLDIGQPIWDGRILLQNAYASPLRVRPRDAVRLRFDWRAGLDLDQRYAVDLSLVDGEGRVWAGRRSEPCGGWCRTDTWQMAGSQQDQHALLVPPGTPPGTYRLEVTWVPFPDGPALPVEKDGQVHEHIFLTEVTVLPALAGTDTPEMLPGRLQATFGGEITLQDYDVTPAEAQPGGVLHLETIWRAVTTPADDYTLLLELLDSDQQAVAGWEFPPSASFYPTSMWQPGEYLRGQQELFLPTTLTAGLYRLRLALVSAGGERLALDGEEPRAALGGVLTWQKPLAGRELALSPIKLNDRPREFTLPSVQHGLVATVGRRAHLVGYDLDTSQAHPGGQVLLTLYWAADGPMSQQFKVFTHLLDGAGTLVAQHDAEPGGGCCPTNTWEKGEIIVDQHPIALRADLPTGTYQLVAGMYSEELDTRMPAYAADGTAFVQGRIPIGTVIVEPATVSSQEVAEPQAPKFELGHKAFLPQVDKGP